MGLSVSEVTRLHVLTILSMVNMILIIGVMIQLAMGNTDVSSLALHQHFRKHVFSFFVFAVLDQYICKSLGI